MKYVALFLVFALSAIGCGPVQGQDDADRRDQIHANLQVHFPQLREYEFTVGALEPSGIEGLDQGSFVLRGNQQTQHFLVTEDNTKLYFISGDPIDVSMTEEEVEATLAASREIEAQQAREKAVALMAALPALPSRGNPDAPVTIVEFSDFQCPYCARGYQTMERVLEQHADDVRFVFAHYPLPNHDWARPASIAAECAGNQDEAAFWTLHDAYFDNQRGLTTENILLRSRDFLSDAGIDMGVWQTCAVDATSDAHQAAAAKVDQTLAVGQDFGVTGTPGFFINGHFINGAQPPATFERYIARAKEEVR